MTGLNSPATQASKSMKSTIMSFWYLTVAAGMVSWPWSPDLAGAGATMHRRTPGGFWVGAVLTFYSCR